ncbi:MAG: hypothetical protein KAR79_03405 [Simkaniaceae bacterium]|nr:hypothetical protein [Simkaniaceae bacterium]
MKTLPFSLQSVIDELLEKIPAPKLKEAAERLSFKYRNEQGRKDPFIDQENDPFAYLCYRFPATFAAISRVFEEFTRHRPGFSPKSIVDFGAGPGTSSWAVAELFPNMEKLLLVERDAKFIRLGKELLHSNKDLENRVDWKLQDFQRVVEEAFDLTLFSYSLGEAPESCWSSLIGDSFEKTKEFMIIIEPGTTLGFSRILKFREILISLGATIVAPCPNQMACPMQFPNWCHFGVRLARSPMHQLVKLGSCSFEDEKFSYLIASKNKCEPFGSRLVSSPEIKKGHVNLTLCKEGKIVNKTISKKDKSLYKKSKKSLWGDVFLNGDII